MAARRLSFMITTVRGALLHAAGFLAIWGFFWAGFLLKAETAFIIAAFMWVFVFRAWINIPGVQPGLQALREVVLPHYMAQLNRADQLDLVEALARGFTPAAFERMARFRLGRSIGPYKSGGTIDWEKLVAAANRERWIGRLVEGAFLSNTDNRILARLYHKLGLTSAADLVDEGDGALETIVRRSQSFQNIDTFIFRLTAIERCVCRISYTGPYGPVYGTGFLVAPDIVMTNDHVIAALRVGESDPASVEFLFDFKAGSTRSMVEPSVFKLNTEDWLIESSPHSRLDFIEGEEPGVETLDYALLRLSEPAGDLPIGVEGAAQEVGPPRGFIALPTNALMPAKDTLALVLQHPDAKPKKLAIGEVERVNDKRTRLFHSANTLPGSSGSPIFNGNLDLIALHHAGDPNFDDPDAPRVNRAIPIRTLAQAIKTPLPKKEARASGMDAGAPDTATTSAGEGGQP